MYMTMIERLATDAYSFRDYDPDREFFVDEEEDDEEWNERRSRELDQELEEWSEEEREIAEWRDWRPAS